MFPLKIGFSTATSNYQRDPEGICSCIILPINDPHYGRWSARSEKAAFATLTCLESVPRPAQRHMVMGNIGKSHHAYISYIQYV